MEVGGDSRVETQTHCRHWAVVKGLRQDYPCISSGVAHHVIEFISGIHLPAHVEEKATAAVPRTDPPVARQEGQRRVQKWRFFGPPDADEFGNSCYLVLLVQQVVRVEEARYCLGNVLAVLRVRDEAVPVTGDALESADRFDRQARQYVDDEVIGEAGGGSCGSGPLLGGIHPFREHRSVNNPSPLTTKTADLISCSFQ